MTDIRAVNIMTILAAVGCATFGATILSAEENEFQQACQTFDGTYEERRTGCDPDCIVTYICRFDDGSGRECDEEGTCGPLGSGMSATAEGDDEDAAAGTDPAEGDYADRGECVQAERSTCQDQCSGKSRREMASCVSSCVDEACGDYASSSDEGDTEAAASSGEASCEDCQNQCEQKCANARGPMKKKCQSQCEQACG